MTRFGLLLLSGLCLVFVFHVAFLVSSLNRTVTGVIPLLFSWYTFEKAGVGKVKGINWNKVVELGHSDLEDWIEPFVVVIKRPLSTCVFNFKGSRS